MRNKISFRVILNKVVLLRVTLLCLVSLCFANTTEIFGQQSPRRFYNYDVVATTTPNLEVYTSPSINDYGEVAFAGRRNPGGGTVFLSEIGQSPVNLMPSLSLSPLQFVSGRVQINNLQQVIQQTFVSVSNPSINYLRRLEGVDQFTLLAVANDAGPFNDFDQIHPTGFSINDLGEPVFLTRQGSNSTILTTGIRPNFSTLQFPSMGESIQPMISNNGCVIVRAGASASDPLRLYNYDLTAFDTIASINEGFTEIGKSNSLSEGCEVIAFYGNLNQSGADAIGTNPGPGIFASIDIDNNQRKIVRLAGRLIEDNSAPGGNDDGYCDPGETCIQGELGFNQNNDPIFFNSFFELERVAVTHQPLGAVGIEDDIFVVSFLGTPNIASDNPERPFSNQKGLWTLTTQIIREKSGDLREKPTVAVPVVQLGDVIEGRTVTGINVYDQIGGVRTPTPVADRTTNVPIPSSESPGGHRLAFHVNTNNGNMIVRANREIKTPVIFIPGVGGSVLSEVQGSNLIERWTGGLNPSNYERLSLAPGQEHEIVAVDAVREIQLAGFPVLKVYKELLEELTTTAGLIEYKVENKPERRTFEGCDTTQALSQPNLFVFAYDWRKSNSENAVKLADYIRCVQRFYPETKVDIVAHSMGGLLARKYISNNSSNHNVEKMVTIGSPFLGAPRMIEVLEEGNFFNVGANFVTAIRGLRPTGANRVFKQLIPYLKGSHELLPSEKYFSLGGLPFSERFDFNEDGLITTYNYPTIFSAFNLRYQTQPYQTN